MATKTDHVGFVLTDRGNIFIQVPATNRHGFSLADDDTTWDGGVGVANEWEALDDDDERISPEDHGRLDWFLEQARESV